MSQNDDLIDAEFYQHRDPKLWERIRQKATADREAKRFSHPKAPATILAEADSIVNGTRAQDYGENSLPRIAEYWSTYLGRAVDGRDVANLMILLKVAREGHGPKRDNHVDIAGYTALADQLP